MTSIARHDAERAAILSALFPGLGQWWRGDRRRAVLWALPLIVAVVLVVVLLLSVGEKGAVGLFGVLVQPGWLWAIVAVNLLVVITRIGAVWDAWRSSRSSDAAGSWWMRGIAVGVAVLLLLPHLVVHSYASEALALLDDVFVDQPVASAAEREAALIAEGFTEEDFGPTTTSSSTTTTTTRPGPIDPESLVVPGTDPVPDFGPLGRRYTVLLAGGDFGPGRKDLRTDVMIVASIDTVTGRAALIGVNRDLAGVPLPSEWADSDTMRSVQRWHEDQAYARRVAAAQEAGEEPPPQVRAPFCNCFYDKLNYLHIVAGTWLRTFPDAPDPGMEALRQTVGLLLGIHIDSYVLVDFAGFVELIDALGGVRVTVDVSLDGEFSPAFAGEESVSIHIHPGVHLLDGREALAYVRDRTDTSDGERMRRQRCMLRELAAQASAGTLLRKFPEISRAIRNSTTTTLPLGLLPAIIEALAGLDTADIATLAIGEPGYTDGRNAQGMPVVNVERTRAAVAELLAGAESGSSLDRSDECPS